MHYHKDDPVLKGDCIKWSVCCSKWEKTESVCVWLIQYDWCPYKRRKLGYRHVCMHKGRTMRRQKETAIFKSRRQKQEIIINTWSGLLTRQNCEKIHFLWFGNYTTMHYFCSGNTINAITIFLFIKPKKFWKACTRVKKGKKLWNLKKCQG